LNSLAREKGDTKEFRRLVLGEFFLAKGEERHKRIQAVSPSFFLKREKRDTKRIQAVSPSFFLTKGEDNEKDE